jgi:putative transposase
MRFRAIQRNACRYPIRLMCRMLDVSHGGYYAWRSRPESRRTTTDRRLVREIREIHTGFRRAYGSPRVHSELVDERRIPCGENRVARLMRKNQIRSRRARRFRVTTNSDHEFPVAPNFLNREFEAKQPDQRWAGDITFIWTREGWLYLAAILDLFSRRVVGWATSNRINRWLTLRALTMALESRSPQDNLLHHSDRGSQYASRDYRDELRTRGITCSMSRKGDCWDNAVLESFFATLKTECIHHEEFQDRREATRQIFRFIEGFYNTTRKHSFLGQISPVQFEHRTLTT